MLWDPNILTRTFPHKKEIASHLPVNKTAAVFPHGSEPQSGFHGRVSISHLDDSGLLFAEELPMYTCK